MSVNVFESLPKESRYCPPFLPSTGDRDGVECGGRGVSRYQDLSERPTHLIRLLNHKDLDKKSRRISFVIVRERVSY